MRFPDALDAIVKKEEEGRARMQKVGRKADAIRFRGEEEASETYNKTREQLKKETMDFTKQLKKELRQLEKRLEEDLKREKGKMKSEAGKRRKKAGEAAYAFMVDQL